MEPITIDQAISDAQDLEAMTLSAGWRIMQQESQALVKAWTRSLINSNDEKETSELKTKIRLMEWILLTPISFIEAAKRAQESKGDLSSQEADATANQTPA